MINCVFEWYYLPEFIITCTEKVRSASVTIPSDATNFSVESYVGLLFMLCAGILGVAIVELLYNKSDWYLTPLVNRVVRRYHWTIERNRLRTMQGHP